ncbi:MAG: adenylate/guanylate cyclase domain-containing protein [Bacteroidota bacterium]
MKRILIFVLILICGLNGSAQLQRIDSLKSHLNQKGKRGHHPPVLLEIARHYKLQNQYHPTDKESLQQSYEYGHQSYQLALEEADTNSMIHAMEIIQWYHRRMRAYSTANKYRLDIQAISAKYGYDINSLKSRKSNMFEVPQKHLGNQCMIFPDSNHQYEFEHLLSSSQDIPWLVQYQGNQQIGKIDAYQGTIWVKLRLRNPSLSPIVSTFYLGRNKYTWQYIDGYLVAPDNTYSHFRTGTAVHDSLKSISGTHGHFQISLPEQSERTLFIQLKGVDERYPPSHVSLTHIDYLKYLHVYSRRRHINGIFQGVILIQFLFFLLLFGITRDKDYGYYSVYIGGLTIFTLTLNYFLDFSLNNMISPLMLYILGVWMATVGILKFSSTYLNFDRILPKWNQPLRIYLMVFSLLCAVFLVIGMLFLQPSGLKNASSISLALFFGILLSLIGLMVFASLILLIVWGIQALRKDYEPARYFLIASFFLLLGIMVPTVLALINTSNSFLDLFSPEVLTSVFQAGIILQLSCYALGVGHKRNRLVKSQKEALKQKLELQQKINAATERFVPFEFLTSLGRDSILDVNLGDQVEKEVSVFFADIRDYTTLSETMTPKENFSFLNAYLGRVGPIIKANRGFVNQYYGDGIMALFMSSETAVSSPRDALEAAIEVQHIIRIYNQSRVDKYRLPLKIGIGIHSGPLMLGVLGDETRMDVGVVSDAVNTASRMEGLTKHFGASILASESTLMGITSPQDFKYRFLGLVLVKGKKDPLGVYEFFEGDPPEITQLKEQTLDDFEKGLTAYFARQFPEAQSAFRAVLTANPKDHVAQLYLNRSQQLLHNGIPEGWTGVESW